MSFGRFNSYNIMWLVVMFDMPVLTKIERKRAAKFRKNLLKLGFSMMQYSVYIRNCMSLESTIVYKKKVKAIIEEGGDVKILMITDKQIEKMEVFFGRTQYTFPLDSKNQLELF